jgi:hypothetical protein
MIIYDDFIPDLDFLDKICKDKDFWTPGYQWWDGWWESPAKNLRHQLIQKVWGEMSPHRGIDALGFEHWVGDYNDQSESANMLGIDWSLKLHFDKDESHWQKNREIIGPKIGTVFYPCREVDEVEGGMLYFWDKYDATKLTPEGWVTDPDQEPEIIRPKFNRLIIFDASKLHGVSKITKGRRRAIAINLWDKKPLEFEDAKY